jgi:hypothetical protein
VAFVVAALSAILLGATGARAGTFCQKAIATDHGKVVRSTNGVIVYTNGSAVFACSESKHQAPGLVILDKGYKVVQVEASNGRCVAIRFGGAGKLDQILMKDLGGKQVGSGVQDIGYGLSFGKVYSMSVSPNCAVAWGEATGGGSGPKTYRVRLEAFGSATSVPYGVVQEIATVKSVNDVKGVEVTAQGRKVRVRWTEGGVAKAKVLPA